MALYRRRSGVAFRGLRLLHSRSEAIEWRVPGVGAIEVAGGGWNCGCNQQI